MLNDRRMFIDEQASLDLAVGVLVDGHTWEGLRDALRRAAEFMPVQPPAAAYGGLSLQNTQR